MRAMPPYPVACGGCDSPAEFKIAAEWSDGPTNELKTYYLSCAACLKSHLNRAGHKQRACRLTPGETLAAPGVYELTPGVLNHNLSRRMDLE